MLAGRSASVNRAKRLFPVGIPLHSPCARLSRQKLCQSSKFIKVKGL
jgi:hypothetical protein